ncbi:MAG: hypothetical protein ACOYMA_06000 [Bacteroidia bacterium]
MKKQLYFIFLFLVFGLTTSAQTVDYIKFEGTNNEKGFMLFIGKEYFVKLNPYLITNVLNLADSNYNPDKGIKLKLSGCNKDSLFFEKDIGIPIMVIQSLDNIIDQTIMHSIGIAVNFAVIGVINYSMWQKFNHYQFTLAASSPFALTAIILAISKPKNSKFYMNRHYIKEYRYRNKVTNKIHYYNISKKKNIFGEY